MVNMFIWFSALRRWLWRRQPNCVNHAIHAY